MNLLSRSTVIVILALSQFAMAQTSNSNASNSAQNTTTTTVVVEQPTTMVEASPLNESQAERIRKKRQESEIHTEQKIVEKLESSRLEDEQKRADRLFGNKLDSQQQEEKKVEVYQQQQMPQQQVVVPVVVEEKSKMSSSDKQEILDAIKAKESADAKIVAEIPKEEIKPQKRYYISGIVGTSEYADVAIDGKGAAGFTLGMDTDDNVSIEASAIYSNYLMQDNYWITGDPVFREVDQYNLGINAKYSFLTGRFKPYVGAAASFTHRKYFDRAVYTWGGIAIPQENEVTSNAIDLGLSLGLDFNVSESFAIGVEYKWSTNMLYRTDSEIFNRQYRSQGSRLVEESDYSMVLVSGKVRF